MSRLVRRCGLAGIAIAFLGCFLPRAHAQESPTPTQRYELAKTFASSGGLEAALAEFDALLAEFPNDADYLLGRAQMQARLGRTAEAIETTERALTLAPGYEDVWQLRLQLAQRAGDDAAVALHPRRGCAPRAGTRRLPWRPGGSRPGPRGVLPDAMGP